MTTKELIVLAIRELTKRQGFPPSVRQIGAEVGLSSTSTVHAHLIALRESGVIDFDPATPRSIRVVAADGLCPTCGQRLAGAATADAPGLRAGERTDGQPGRSEAQEPLRIPPNFKGSLRFDGTRLYLNGALMTEQELRRALLRAAS
jgi:SOS-response transcriptional repressor LexA